MERAASVFLRSEITAHDADNLINWLENEIITRYLNEDSTAAVEIKNLLERNCSHLLGVHLNKNGRFYMVSVPNRSIGFLKLIETNDADTHEIVIAIGDMDIWGRGYGAAAVKECLKMVFFEWRIKKVIANIDYKNTRSIHLFENMGFKHKADNKKTRQYTISFEDFLKKLSEKNKIQAIG